MNRWRELGVVIAGGILLTVALTYPVAFKIGQIGRIDNADGEFSIWNVSWVARTLVVDPRHVFDANIFYPHRDTLAFSENNLGAGALAIPVYWASRNPYAALNVDLLLAFLLTAIGTYYLVRYLTHDRRGAVVAAICFAFCPYVFAHFSHIQLLMTAGLPFSMLAFHRLADHPTAKRGALLGVAMAGQAVCCGYYGVFVTLIVGYSVVIVVMTRQLWRNPRFWLGLGVGAAVSIVLILPAFLPYLSLQRVAGFHRSLADAASFSANWSAYLASSSYAHAWMLSFLPRWSEVIFPGFVALAFGAVGAWTARRERSGETTLLYGGLVILAFWASFGPSADLYSMLYAVVPMFAWLRAPARFGLVVSFGLSVLAGVGVSAVVSRLKHGTAVGVLVICLAAGELVVPLVIPTVPPVEPVYRTLATLPPGPVIEMPFWYLPQMFPRHADYMLQSTTHWMPLVNGYSDYLPPDFTEHVLTLAPFPSRDAFKLLEPNRVRYALFHMYGYNDENRSDVLARLKEFENYLRPLYMDSGTRLYEIVSFPP